MGRAEWEAAEWETVYEKVRNGKRCMGNCGMENGVWEGRNGKLRNGKPWYTGVA